MDTDSEAEGMSNMVTISGLTPNPQTVKRAKQDASMAAHSLELAAEEFRKICELEIQKLNGTYSANEMLVFN